MHDTVAAAGFETGGSLLNCSGLSSDKALVLVGAAAVDGEGGQLNLRVLVPVAAHTVFEEPRILQVIQPVPPSLAFDADAVEGVYREYQELQLARQGLTRIYALTLTLTVLVHSKVLRK